MLRILRVVGSPSLKCGCFVGVYETYDGETVEIVEERGPRCPEKHHQPGKPIQNAKPSGDRDKTAVGS